jgi:hypothetical protein
MFVPILSSEFPLSLTGEFQLVVGRLLALLNEAMKRHLTLSKTVKDPRNAVAGQVDAAFP